MGPEAKELLASFERQAGTRRSSAKLPINSRRQDRPRCTSVAACRSFLPEGLPLGRRSRPRVSMRSEDDGSEQLPPKLKYPAP